MLSTASFASTSHNLIPPGEGSIYHGVGKSPDVTQFSGLFITHFLKLFFIQKFYTMYRTHDVSIKILCRPRKTCETISYNEFQLFSLTFQRVQILPCLEVHKVKEEKTRPIGYVEISLDDITETTTTRDQLSDHHKPCIAGDFLKGRCHEIVDLYFVVQKTLYSTCRPHMNRLKWFPELDRFHKDIRLQNFIIACPCRQ